MIRIVTITLIWFGVLTYLYPANVANSETTEETMFVIAKVQEDKYFNNMTSFIPDMEKAIECMSLNIYHEARNESADAQKAVAWVVLNRVKSDLFPDSVCKVIYQARYSKWWKETHGKDVPLRHKCQFSWYCDGKSDKVYEWDKYEEAREIAYTVLMNSYSADPTGGALWYHADYVNPNWSSHYDRTAKIGTHIFYRK